MSVVIGGSNYNVGQSYADELARQRSFALQQQQINQADQESRRRAQQVAAQARNQYAIEQMRLQAQQEQHAAATQQAQQFHGDQMAQDQARLAQQNQIQQQHFGQGVLEHQDTIKHWQNLEQIQRDLRTQAINDKRDQDEFRATQKVQTEKDRRAQIVARQLLSDAEEARRYAQTPEDQQTATWLRDRAGDVEAGKIDPENVREMVTPHALPSDVQGPQPKQLPTIEDIRARASEQVANRQKNIDELHIQNAADVKENRTDRTTLAKQREDRIKEEKTAEADRKASPTRSWVSETNDFADQEPAGDRDAYKAYRLAQLRGTPPKNNKFYQQDVEALGQKVIDKERSNMLFQEPDAATLKRRIQSEGEAEWRKIHNRTVYGEKGVSIEEAEKALKGTPKSQKPTGKAPEIMPDTPKVTSQADYDALPVGAQYVAPDGRVLTKK